MTPRIGITTSYQDSRQSVDHHYIRAIEAAGGLPLIVPMLDSYEQMVAFADMLDGLVMTGGPAITKNMIGTLPDDISPTDPVRVRADEAIFTAMRHQPVFGICYGMQFINAQAGGIIYSDIQAHRPHSIVHSAGRGGQDHEVQFDADSRLSRIFDGQRLLVNTFHIQAVAEIGPGLRAVGFGPDGVIEALESEDGRMIGVQFHPERMGERGMPVFTDFVAQCEAWRSR